MKKSLIIKSFFLSLILMFIFTLPALASTAPTINRLSGNTRYETSCAIAKQGRTQSDYAILCYGENYPDALSATPLSKKYNAPILLTNGSNLPDVTKQTLTDLQVKNVFIIGGVGVIPTSIESELQSMGITSTRIAGQDRYDTAIKIAQEITNSPSSIFVVTGDDFADGLSVSPIAGIEQIPIVLVSKNYMPDSVKRYISNLNITKTYVIGDNRVISDTIYDQFPNSERIGSTTQRNVSINQKFDNIFNSDNICFATGLNFADALTGAAYASKISSPLILIGQPFSSTTKEYYQQKLNNVKNVFVFGGDGAVSDNQLLNLNAQTPKFTPVDSGNYVDDIMTCLYNNYSVLDTPIGKLNLTFKVDNNTLAILPWDMRVNTDIQSVDSSGKDIGAYNGLTSGCSLSSFLLNLVYSNDSSVSNENKLKTINELENLQENIAAIATAYYPNKRISGGYYDSFYDYPSLQIGYETIKFLTWDNYDDNLISHPVTTFHWYNVNDDYKFNN